MADDNHISRTQQLAPEIASLRAIIEHGLEVLRTPVPDTFLGRKTQEPFPMEHARVESRAHTSELQPPK